MTVAPLSCNLVALCTTIQLVVLNKLDHSGRVVLERIPDGIQRQLFLVILLIVAITMSLSTLHLCMLICGTKLFSKP